jgi:hypothetical protein
MLPKFCVFCGGKPSNKNKEHILPKWLIKMTGDINRSVNLGINWETGKHRVFSFGSFTFPACSSCNGEFSALEARVKEVITKIRVGDLVNQDECNDFLDWFDKVRVGCWLAKTVLNKNRANIRPKFYIRQRVRMSDRALLIYKTGKPDQALRYAGTEGAIAERMPSVFSLQVNELVFVSISKEFFLHESLGLPTVSGITTTLPEGTEETSLQNGSCSLASLQFLKEFSKKGVCILQPIMSVGTSEKNVYTDEWSASIFGGRRYGKIYQVNEFNVPELAPDLLSLTPEPVLPPLHLALLVGLETVEFQRKLFEEWKCMVKIENDHDGYGKEQMDQSLKVQDLIIKLTKEKIARIVEEELNKILVRVDVKKPSSPNLLLK